MLAGSRHGKAQGSNQDDALNATKAHQLGPGSIVGLTAMLVGEKGAVVQWHEHDDVVAAEPSLVAVIHKGYELQLFLTQLPASSELALQRVVKARLLRTFAASMLGAQAQSAQAQRRLVSIADRCRLVQARGGQTIVPQGGEVNALHILVNGHVTARTKREGPGASCNTDSAGRPIGILKDGPPAGPLEQLLTPLTTPTKKTGVVLGSARASEGALGGPPFEDTIRVVTPGHCFGEGALLVRGAVCDATYKAADSGGCCLLEVPRHLFYQLLGKDRTLLAALHIKLLRTDASLAAILAHPRARAAFAGFVERVRATRLSPALSCMHHPTTLTSNPSTTPQVCGDHHSLDAYEAMRAYAQLSPNSLDAAARSVGESIIAEFMRPEGTLGVRPLQLSDAARRRVTFQLPKHADGHWPPHLFEPAQVELSNLLTKQYVPQFMSHSIFAHVLGLLGSYEAEALFPPEHLATAKHDLITSMEGGGELLASVDLAA